MKVSRIEIKDFNQFKNIDIDLTYPKGHTKAGQPLDKVCFIGQSGTGKTTLLNLIGGHSYRLDHFQNDYDLSKLKKTSISFILKELAYKVRLENKEVESASKYVWLDYRLKGKKIDFDKCIEYKNNQLKLIKNQLINFPADLRYEANPNSDKKNISNKKIIDFKNERIEDVWQIVFDEITKYHEKSLIFSQEIAHIAQITSDIKEIQKPVRRFQYWKKRNKSPIEDIADKCIDRLIRGFNLRVKREVDIQKKEDIGFIKIEDFYANEIPHGLLSTGTKQILYSALPLYLLKPENTIILFDEPERSLYPDMQRMIIDFYSSLTKDSQFFYATHSPIIASSFEPWEIIELKLDENGHVYQDIYYEGERHVDNYHIVPQYLSYDKMLRNVFDLDETRNQIGIDKIGDALMYKNHLLKLKKEKRKDTKEFEELYLKYTKLAEQLAWDFNVLDDEKS